MLSEWPAWVLKDVTSFILHSRRDSGGFSGAHLLQEGRSHGKASHCLRTHRWCSAEPGFSGMTQPAYEPTPLCFCEARALLHSVLVSPTCS
ncbi:rCG58469 [Rattus norvegicus]|uniref:RCG58469 n=1 Tax=Rattus norvegicus TaxID=10116 RepID=A6J3R6_RAT|nr:rCG58469 [Rattus norvegicus]